MFAKIGVIGFFACIAYLYLHNLSPSIYGGDVGDLVTAAVVFGVPHPPGYPLFTILGYIFAHLPFSLTPAYKVGLISALSSIAGLFIFYKIGRLLTKNLPISLLATSILAFSYLYWFYAEIAEVFALNNLFVLVIFYSALLFHFSGRIKYFYLTVFLCSLALTNHHTVILIFPSILILLFRLRLNKLLYTKPLKQKTPLSKAFFLYSYYFLIPIKHLKKIGIVVLLCILGFVPYLYIPIAASQNPPINWDEASNLKNFIHLILRRDYGTFKAGVFDAAPFAARLIILKIYFVTLISSLTFPATVIAILGIWYSLLKQRKIAISLLVSFLLSGPVFVVYAGFPLVNSFTQGASERFYIVSSIILALFLPYGFLCLFLFLKKVFSKKIYAMVILAVFLIIPLLLLKHNMARTDLSRVDLGDKLAQDILHGVSDTGVMFSSGDTVTFNSWYAHYALGVKPQVEIVHLLGAGHKKFFENARDEFMKKNPGVKDPSRITEGTVKDLRKKRTVYTTTTFSIDKETFTWVPVGLSQELVYNRELPSKDAYVKRISEAWETISIPYREKATFAERNLSLSDIPQYYADSLIFTAQFIEKQYQDKDLAIEYYKKALLVDPDNSKAHAFLGVILYIDKKDCHEAEKHFVRAKDANLTLKSYYTLLYVLYKNCLKDTDKMNRLASDFYAVFHNRIEDEVKKTDEKK